MRSRAPLVVKPLHGEPGVLAYDPAQDRIQCAICGRWLQKIEARHLALHGFSIAEYKELCGLNVTTPLEIPRIREARQRKNAEHKAWRNLSDQYRLRPGEPRTPRETRAQSVRENYNSERQRGRARCWSDEEMLAELRRMQEQRGGTLRLADLARDRPGQRGVLPGRNTVIERFGSRRRICELLGQPYRLGRPPKN
ncbi:MAG TPA: MucR family transcriptional regulator [Chloroflexota bacterium]|nr:MucR family transcriptional regulator [Chloroflexota bacterium]